MNDEKKMLLMKKVQKKFPDFTDNVDSLPLDELEKNMLIYAKHRESVEWSRKQDIELTRAQEAVKDLQAPYKEALSAIKLKMSYLNMLIEDAEPTQN